MFIMRRVLPQRQRGYPFFLCVGEAPVLVCVVILPQKRLQGLMEFFQRQQFTPVQHFGDVLFDLVRRPGGGQRAGVGCEFPGVPAAEGSKGPLNRLVPWLIGQGPRPSFRSHRFVKTFQF